MSRLVQHQDYYDLSGKNFNFYTEKQIELAAVNNLNTGRRESASSGADNTSALVFGGETPSDTAVANTEEWNGVSWAEVNNLNVVKNVLAGNGTQSSALAYGGNPGPGVVATTEAWNLPSTTTKTISTD